MQPSPNYYQQVMIPQTRRKGPNCLKPVIGCTFGPILLVLLIGACSFACLAALALSGSDALYDNFEPDRAEAQTYENSIENTLQTALSSGSGRFTLRIREREFSSWLNYEYQDLFAKYDMTGDENWEYVDPEFQVRFRNDQVHFYAGNQFAVVTLGTVIKAEVAPPPKELSRFLVDINITEVTIGGLNLGNDSFSSLENDLAEILTDQIETYAVQAEISDISIESVEAREGILTITGQISR
ncbi:MAG: hypothetical protein GYB66_04895 [Chloroflexi bacterium]|nr:hypothetical protein [Chloroflexota bacterium]